MESLRVGNKLSSYSLQGDSENIFEFLIVGAGLCGLSLGWILAEHFPDLNIQLVEKSKSSGGRMATRRIDDLKFDHGAQFIKIVLESEKWVEIWNHAGVINPFPDKSVTAVCGKSGLTQLAKVLAHRLSVKFNYKIKLLQRSKFGWTLLNDQGETIHAKNVVLTCPLPQALEILEHSELIFDPAMSEIKYASALVILIESTEEVGTGRIYEENKGDGIFSICAQHSKDHSNRPHWTVVMSPEWSQTHYEWPEDQILAESVLLIKNLRPDIQIQKMHLKKWKYSHPLQSWSKLFEKVESGLYLAGDAFGGPSLLGALRSSSELGKYLKGGSS